MSGKPIFMAAHPRACSTAFERVFMTRRDILECMHEPFGDAFYYGPERLSERFEGDENARIRSGFSGTTYKDVMDKLLKGDEEKRVFIKDIAYYLFPPHAKPAAIAPSLSQRLSNGRGENGIANGVNGVNGVANGTSGVTDGVNGTNGHAHNGAGAHANGNGTPAAGSKERNPTVIPVELLRRFHFTFLIRHPRRAIPSYYRCTVPPLSDVTTFDHFMPSEAGYDEMRRLFDYLRGEHMIGGGEEGEEGGGVPITVIDADDLLDHPDQVIEAYCRATGIDFRPDMLQWDDRENQDHASKKFVKWIGFHEDAIGSTSLKPRSHKHKTSTTQSEDDEWRKTWGKDAQRVIRETVDANVADYEYLKSFALEI